MTTTNPDLAAQMLGMTRDDFETLVIAEAKGDAGDHITEVLRSDLLVAERWYKVLRQKVAHNVRKLELEAITEEGRKRGTKWVKSATTFLAGIEPRLVEAEVAVAQLRREHEHGQLCEIALTLLAEIDSCPRGHDVDMTDQCWSVVDRLLAERERAMNAGVPLLLPEAEGVEA